MSRKARLMAENLTDQPPKRRRTGRLSDRQQKALDAIRQRPRSTAELAAILGTTGDNAQKTALALVRRDVVALDRDVPVRWRALGKPNPYAVACPACNSEPGDPCFMRRPPWDPCAHPHGQRYAAAKIAQRGDSQNAQT